jgi:hypothetical protein
MAVTTLSYTSMSTYLRCRAKYHWKYIQGWEPVTKAKALRLGSAGHKALSSWYSQHDPDVALKMAWSEFWADAEGGLDTDQDTASQEWTLLEETLKRYMAWAPSNDHWQVRGVEHELRLPLPGFEGWSFIGFIDLIVEQGGALWILDHKFSSRAMVPPTLDLQTQLYAWALQLSGWGRVAGSFYNVIRMGSKIAETQPVLRGPVQFSQGGIPLLEQDVQRVTSEIQRLGSPEVPIYRHVTPDCSWDCPYKQVCLALQQGDDWREVLATTCQQRER